MYDRFGWNPVYFILLLCVVQLVHDIGFYLGVINPIPTGHNEMMDTFKAYAKDLGGTILAGDALLMISSALVAMVYKFMPLHAFVSASSLFSYALPYILFTRNPYLLEEAERKVALEKEAKEKKFT